MQGEHSGRRYTPKNRRLVREPERRLITGVPKSTAYLLIKQSRFPKQCNLTDQTVAWVEDELYEYNKQRIADRDRQQ